MIFENTYKDTVKFNLYLKGERTDMTYTLKNPESEEMKSLKRSYENKATKSKSDNETAGIGRAYMRDRFIKSIVAWENFKEKNESGEVVDMTCSDDNKAKLFDEPKYALVVDSITRDMEDRDTFF